MTLRIERVTDASTVLRGAHLFDEAVDSAATSRFLASPTHHLLFAYDDEVADPMHPVGMISAAELTHPDKGTEMFLNELGVDEVAQGRGIGAALVRSLAELARSQGAQACGWAPSPTTWRRSPPTGRPGPTRASPSWRSPGSSERHLCGGPFPCFPPPRRRQFNRTDRRNPRRSRWRIRRM